jgi:hypothetical protein
MESVNALRTDDTGRESNESSRNLPDSSGDLDGLAARSDRRHLSGGCLWLTDLKNAVDPAAVVVKFPAWAPDAAYVAPVAIAVMRDQCAKRGVHALLFHPDRSALCLGPLSRKRQEMPSSRHTLPTFRLALPLLLRFLNLHCHNEVEALHDRLGDFVR